MGDSKNTDIEKIYQKKSQLEHILLRPDTYIGSIEHVQEQMWIYDHVEKRMIQRQINYVPGLYKIFDEILVNAADNKQRDKNMNCIRININQDENTICIWNNGKGIPVVMHKDENMYVPTMIFGHLLTSSNYDDDEEKVVGGRNGYGAKLCNIFSVKFIIETASSEYNQYFKQVWGNNMSKASEPKVKSYSGDDYTKVTFSPDLQKFGMTRLDDDIVALMCRRAYDIAASTQGVTVMLNDEKIKVKSFKDYINLYLKSDSDKLFPLSHQTINDRWEIAVTISEKGFQQVSFVNSIATTKGGRHVDYITDMIVKQLLEFIKKKNKGGLTVKPFQVKNHLWIFINCLIVNPAFDSQTKENMTTQSKKFGSKCDIPDLFIQQFAKSGIVEIVLNWAKFKAQNELNKQSGKKQTKLKGVGKLEDANEAGTKNAHKCTLILTEGDSAKCLAVSGLGVIGRDYYGVFPLRGKLLNVREATHKQILDNVEINNLIKIIGLQHKKKYHTFDDLKTLRYGKVMIMTDQDQDGSHIKGLIINFIHHFWPELLKLNFLEIFITPIVKASKKNKELSFYSLPEFEEWKMETDDYHTYHIKYYKGLGTSTSKEAKEYFKDMERHRILLKYTGTEDDNHIVLAFSKKEIEGRKDWLLQHCEEIKRRKEMGLPELYLYAKNTKSVTYTDYVNKELVYFSNGDNVRSIPSVVDGFKPGQRKVLFTCMKRNDKREVKVAQLAGSVAEMSAYHHGEISLCSTIVNLAQNFVGSNNINLLEPRGQFGTRLNGGKDSASPRYIFTKMSPLTRLIFHPHDDPILKYEIDDNQKVEPMWYIPIIPMVLVNGADGIGTGWRSKVPNFNPREIVENIRLLLDGREPLPMKPWYKNFTGTIEDCTQQRFVVNGEIIITDIDEVEITELPINTWTQVYKENVLETMLYGNEKQKAVLHDYKEYSTDTTVKFVVKTLPGVLNNMEKEGVHNAFKLSTTMYTSTMYLFDEYGGIKKYEYAEDILKEFYTIRLRMYEKRKIYLENQLEAESERLTYQAKFIVEKCNGTITVENKKRHIMVEELKKCGYPADPVKVWKERIAKENNDVPDVAESQVEEEEEDGGGDDGQADNEIDDTDALEFDESNVKSIGKKKKMDPDSAFKNSKDVQKYDYLLGMSMWMLTLERKNQLLKQRDDKLIELKILKEKKPSDLWVEDLDVFLRKLDEIEEKERKEELETMKKFTVKGKTKSGKAIPFMGEIKKEGQRIVPRLSMHIVKATKAKEAKEKKVIRDKERKQSLQSTTDNESDKDSKKKKTTKKQTTNTIASYFAPPSQEEEDKDEYDLLVDNNKVTLKEKLETNTLLKIEPDKATNKRGRKKKTDDGLVQAKLNFSSKSTSSSSAALKVEKENIDLLTSDTETDTKPAKKPRAKKATTATAKTVTKSKATKNTKPKGRKKNTDSDTDSDLSVATKTKKKTIINSDSDIEIKSSKKTPLINLDSDDDYDNNSDIPMFDSDSDFDSKKPKKKQIKIRRVTVSDDESEEEKMPQKKIRK